MAVGEQVTEKIWKCDTCGYCAVAIQRPECPRCHVPMEEVGEI